MTAKKPNLVFFDSSIYINLLRYPKYERKIETFLQGSYLHAISKIVLMELWTGARTKIEENILIQLQKSFPPMTFSDDNFIFAGQVMHKIADLHHFESQMRRRLTWDILIALSARESNALLVTENESDFKKIQKYIDFEFVAPNIQ